MDSSWTCLTTEMAASRHWVRGLCITSLQCIPPQRRLHLNAILTLFSFSASLYTRLCPIGASASPKSSSRMLSTASCECGGDRQYSGLLHLWSLWSARHPATCPLHTRASCWPWGTRSGTATAVVSMWQSPVAPALSCREGGIWSKSGSVGTQENSWVGWGGIREPGLGKVPDSCCCCLPKSIVGRSCLVQVVGGPFWLHISPIAATLRGMW